MESGTARIQTSLDLDRLVCCAFVVGSDPLNLIRVVRSICLSLSLVSVGSKKYITTQHNPDESDKAKSEG